MSAERRRLPYATPNMRNSLSELTAAPLPVAVFHSAALPQTEYA